MRFIPSLRKSSPLLNRLYAVYEGLANFPERSKYDIHRWRGHYDLYSATAWGRRLFLNGEHLRMLLSEAAEWEKYYGVPIGSSGEGGTVLDVGSGCGEVAPLFFSRGARKVVGIEPDLSCARAGALNSRHGDYIHVRRAFRLEDLSMKHDFLKMDCEGCEAQLLEWDGSDLGPCRMEVHPLKAGIPDLCERLMRKFRLRIVYRTTPNTWVLGG